LRWATLSLDTGRHQTEITARRSPLRQGLWLLNLALLCGGAAWIWIERKKNVTNSRISLSYFP
jgi:hypothetical protein